MQALIQKAASVHDLRQTKRSHSKTGKDAEQISIKDKLAEFKLERLEQQLENLYGVRKASFSFAYTTHFVVLCYPFSDSSVSIFLFPHFVLIMGLMFAYKQN